MAAVTAITNPLDLKETLLFYCSTYQQVGLSPRKEDADEPQGDESDPIENTPAFGKPLCGEPPERCVSTGIIKSLSSFGSILFKNLICIYGIRTDGRICLFSPAYHPLKSGSTTRFNRLAACGDGNAAGWLYYLNNDPPKINECHLTAGETVVPQATPDRDSYLCAYYDSPKRYCIYQVSGGLSIIEVSGGTGGLIKNTSNAKSPTPMAVIKNNNAIYLYYSDTSNNLLRITQKNGSWNSSALVDGAQPMKGGTQLAVAKTRDGAYNMLFYLPQDGGSGAYYMFKDPANV